MNSSWMTEMTTKTLHRLSSHAALLAALLLTGTPTQAADPAPDGAMPAATAATSSEPMVQPLARLTNVSGPMRLVGVDAEQRLTLPLSSRLDVRSATLHLEVTSSMAMLENVSSLTVMLNG